MSRNDFDPDSVVADGRKAAKASLFEIEKPGPWRGHVPGEVLGASTTVLAYGTDTIGDGPRLHVHPYDETFIVVAGHARFFVGDQVIEASAGEIVLGPRGVPHRFENLGPGRLQTLDIHQSPTWIQTDIVSKQADIE